MTPENIILGFKAPVVNHFNPSVIPDSAFAPAQLLEWPQNVPVSPNERQDAEYSFEDEITLAIINLRKNKEIGRINEKPLKTANNAKGHSKL
ncbi:hypothetical protein JTB14_000762 [Gonioctena quinquepunctata]|nr:hypothetical protein JTB14_000762 [Gonioctena quinquepunctata]